MNPTRSRRRFIGLATAAIAAGAMSLNTAYASDRPVTIVVPNAPGGTTDKLGRLLAHYLSPLLKRQIIVENRPGAGTGIGAAYVARARPDGDTLLLATVATIAVNPALYTDLSYDPQRDFDPIGLVAAVPLVAVVRADSKANSIADLIKVAQEHPGKLSFGSAGAGTPQHLSAEVFKAATGTNMVHVPYKGSSPALTDLLAGNLDFMFCDIQPTLPHLSSGKLKALGVTSLNPQPSVPSAVPIAKAGIPDLANFEVVAWQALMAPKGTPPELVKQYAQALATMMHNPEVRAVMERDGIEPRYMGPGELAKFIASETDRWGSLVKRLNLRAH